MLAVSILLSSYLLIRISSVDVLTEPKMPFESLACFKLLDNKNDTENDKNQAGGRFNQCSVLQEKRLYGLILNGR